jgi:hypothetical protein
MQALVDIRRLMQASTIYVSLCKALKICRPAAKYLQAGPAFAARSGRSALMAAWPFRNTAPVFYPRCSPQVEEHELQPRVKSAAPITGRRVVVTLLSTVLNPMLCES